MRSVNLSQMACSFVEAHRSQFKHGSILSQEQLYCQMAEDVEYFKEDSAQGEPDSTGIIRGEQRPQQ